MEELVRQFETYLLTEKRVASNTLHAYLRDIRQFEQFLGKHNLTFDALTTQQLKSFLSYLKDNQISARSMARKISALRSFLQHAHAQGEQLSESLITPKIEKKLPQFLSEQEIEQLLKIADQDMTKAGMRNRVMLYMLYVTGMRISELISMLVEHIYFDTGVVVVRGKGGHERMIPLPLPMLEMVRDYVTGLKHNDTKAYLFATTYGGTLKPITRQAFWVILKKMWQKTGNKRPISPHQLRHSLATHLLKNGADLRSLQLLLGHENIATVQVYTHVETGYLRTIYDKKHPRA